MDYFFKKKRKEKVRMKKSTLEKEQKTLYNTQNSQVVEEKNIILVHAFAFGREAGCELSSLTPSLLSFTI